MPGKAGFAKPMPRATLADAGQLIAAEHVHDARASVYGLARRELCLHDELSLAE